MNGLVDNTCRGCRHLIAYRGYGAESGMHCNYFMDTGYLRGCPAGRGCTKRETRNGGRPKKEEKA